MQVIPDLQKKCFGTKTEAGLLVHSTYERSQIPAAFAQYVVHMHTTGRWRVSEHLHPSSECA